MSRTVVVLVVLLVVAPLSGASVAGANQVTLTVSVTDQSGNPVAGTDLTATWDGGSTTAETRSNGKAFVDVPDGADVEIEAEHPEYVRNHPVVVESATEREVAIDVSQRGSATISVADADSQVADARVILRKNGRIVEDGRTASDGTYETDVIEDGQYTVTVVKRGYYREQESLTVDGDVEQSVTIERGAINLGVRVTDPHFEPPRAVGGATISIESVGQFETQPDGTAAVGVPVNAELQMTVTGDEYETITRTVTVSESDVSVNVSLSRAPQLTLESASQRVIAGERTVVTVRNEYGEPVEGATVLLDDESMGETDANGQLTVTVSEPGDHALLAESAELQSDPLTITGVNVDGGTPTSEETEEPEETEKTEETDRSDASAPGFTFATAVLALLSIGLIVARR